MNSAGGTHHQANFGMAGSGGVRKRAVAPHEVGGPEGGRKGIIDHIPENMKFSTLVILDFMSRKDADGMLLVTAIVGIGTMLTVMALATAIVVLVDV